MPGPVRFCPRCGDNRRFVGRLRVVRTLLDLVLGSALENDTGIGLRKLRCRSCGLPASKAARTAFPS